MKKITWIFLISLLVFSTCDEQKQKSGKKEQDKMVEIKIKEILSKMTLRQKIGQMSQITLYGELNEEIKEKIRKGELGSILNAGDFETKKEIQRIAREESELGIPLIFGRDVIHGYRTIFPIPLGQAASWNQELIEKAASVAADEASANGVHWTFAPMIDMTRDPRWGRIAETCGEDALLTSRLGAAMVKGFQGKNLSDSNTIAACAKHYVGYGAAEGGRDYNSTHIPNEQLWNYYLPPFKAAKEAGVSTYMSAFNDINGIPATGNKYTLRTVLRDKWNFDGFVVSDWNSVVEMINHGVCKNEADAAKKAVQAGVDMEMVSSTYIDHIENLVEKNVLSIELIDQSVKNILRIKYRLGLFDNPVYGSKERQQQILNKKNLALAKELATQSVVMLKNENNALPVSPYIENLAIIGPLADAPAEQLGTWTMDGKPEDAITPLTAIREFLNDSTKVIFAQGLENSRGTATKGFQEALNIAQQADKVILFAGEEAILSGEAHNRAFLNLPGKQEELIDTIVSTGKPVILVIMAGRPLAFERIAKKVDAILYAWHPGTMAGPALADLIFGIESPSGKLPVSFVRTAGQIPTYYNHRNTGRPPLKKQDIPTGTPLDPVGFTSRYLDVNYTPAYPFGYGLSYAEFEYKNLKISKKEFELFEDIEISVDVINKSDVKADEVVQLYVQDLVRSIAPPVKELKAFKRINLKPGETKNVKFILNTDILGFYNQKLEFVTEPGEFMLWVSGSSLDEDAHKVKFTIK